jgi:large subunit ribosomal protein L10
MNESIRQQKVGQVSELVELIQSSKSMIVADYLGLSVEQMTNLRRKLYEAGCSIEVIKNNITRRAVEEVGYSQLDEQLVGPNAIAFSKDDAIAAAKILYDFSLTADKLELKAGVIDGKYVGYDELLIYAKLPSRETLLTQVAAGLLGTVRDLAIALQLFSEIGNEAAAPEPVKAPPAPAENVVEAAPAEVVEETAAADVPALEERADGTETPEEGQLPEEEPKHE